MVGIRRVYISQFAQVHRSSVAIVREASCRFVIQLQNRCTYVYAVQVWRQMLVQVGSDMRIRLESHFITQ